MIDTHFVRELQEAGRVDDRVAAFVHDFRIGTLLNKAGIKKLRGIAPRALFADIFLLSFSGANFYRGIVKNGALGFKKDAAYALLRNPCHNWRSFLLSVAKPIIRFMEVLTSERRVKVFIIDDTVPKKSSSSPGSLTICWAKASRASKSSPWAGTTA